MADGTRLELRIKTVLLDELRAAANDLGNTYTVSRLAADILESWTADRRLPRFHERAMISGRSENSRE